MQEVLNYNYLLAFDTSGKSLALALFQKDKLLVEKFLNINHQHSINFLPALQNLCQEASVSLQKLDVIASTVGPGSFTGIRIGVSTANTLAYDLNIPVLGISSLEALAYPLIFLENYVFASFDARGGRVYGALFKGGKRKFADQQFVANDLVDTLVNLDLQKQKIYLVGDGSETAASLLKSNNFKCLEQIYNSQRLHAITGEAVGRLAIRQIRQEPEILIRKYQEPISPRYAAITQAERNLRDKK